jgi:NADH:ubiquinone oxidoreductase subunit F (NADH-binding)
MTLPRLLRGIEPMAMPYRRHLEVHGDIPVPAQRRHDFASALVAEITRAGLKGRGGGGFPLATKLDAVRRSRGSAVVVVNGCEGEPMSYKDRVLLEALPHLVLDGAICCARALGTRDIVLAVDRSFDEARRTLADAISERAARGGRERFTIEEIPSGYVSGQESAVVSFLGDGPPKPQAGVPRITERGVDRRPTLMSNAETLAQLALLVRHGAAWFREVGTEDEPGSALITVNGAVRHPGVFEIASGSSLRPVLEAAGGLTGPARAVLFGGYAGTWVDADVALRTRLCRSSMRAINATLGAGIVVVLPQSACPVAETTRVAGWMAGESAGQCGPCSHGLNSIADALSAVSEGRADHHSLGDVRRWTELVRGRGACAHPDGVAGFVVSAVSVFAQEFDDHARRGPCPACRRPAVLATPETALAAC